MNCNDIQEHLVVFFEGRGGWGELGLGVRIVMEYLVTTNYIHIGRKHDRNNQLVVHYRTIICINNTISSQHKIFG